MDFVAPRATAILFASLLAGLSPIDSSASPHPFDTEAYRWANGRVIDTVYVHDNKRVAAIAILREMESRQGSRLDARAVERDQRYLGDLSAFATVAIHVEPVGEDRCALHVVVTERPPLLLKLVYPVLEYDVNTERIEYGVKWDDRNFRHRLENLSVDFRRDDRDNNAASAAWSTSWIGWKHLGTGVRVSYFNRAEPSSTPVIVEQARLQTHVALPLTQRRIAFTQLLFGAAFANNRIGVQGDVQDEVLLSPSLGFRFDDRDAPLKPHYGRSLLLNLQANRVLEGEGSTYYRLDNDLRWFHALDAATVLAVRSNLAVQLAHYPEYIRFGLGGAGTVRGLELPDARFAHRWVQSVEIRITPWREWFYKLPVVGNSDFLLGIVAFVDTGIGWNSSDEFRYDNFHSGFGVGLRLFSPFQDVVRFDVGYTPSGNVHPYLATGLNF